MGVSNIVEHLRIEAKSYDLEDVCTSDFQGSRQDLLALRIPDHSDQSLLRNEC